MKSLADGLPPEIARQIHPDWRKNEAGYWAVRDQLLGQYLGQWVGFADGAVIASGTSPVAVFHAAGASGRHPFFICVGREEEPCRIRGATFPSTSDGSRSGDHWYRHECRSSAPFTGLARAAGRRPALAGRVPVAIMDLFFSPVYGASRGSASAASPSAGKTRSKILAAAGAGHVRCASGAATTAKAEH
jgi:hypothetical protein